jgi:hypothetical protein
MEGGIIDEVFAFSRELSANDLKDVIANGAFPQAVDAKAKLATTWSAIKTRF